MNTNKHLLVVSLPFDKIKCLYGIQYSSVVDPDPELFPGSGMICSGSLSSKNERADN